MSDTKKYVEDPNDIAQDLERERKEQAWAQFEKSVLEVAEAFFAMSENERKAMVEYVQERADEAEQQAKELTDKKNNPKDIFNFCPKCGCKLNDEYNFCPKCGLDLTEAKKDA